MEATGEDGRGARGRRLFSDDKLQCIARTVSAVSVRAIPRVGETGELDPYDKSIFFGTTLPSYK